MTNDGRYDGRYDDPKFINAFLADMKSLDVGVSDHSQSVLENAMPTQTGEAVLKQTTEPKSCSGANTPAVTSAASSPPAGIRAPPPTPENKAASANDVHQLPPISEDQVSPKSKMSTTFENRIRTNEENLQYQESKNSLFQSDMPTAVIQPTSTELSQHEVQVEDYRQDLIETTKDTADHTVAEPAIGESDSVGLITNAAERIKLTKGYHKDAELNHKCSSAETFENTHNEHTAVSLSANDSGEFSVNIIVEAPKSPCSFNSEQSLVANSTPDATRTMLDEELSLKKKEIIATEYARSQLNASEHDEPREDAIYFSTWGSPEMREAEASRVRKVILTNLSANTDFSLIHSLIHGGAIEHMNLSPAADGSLTAFVTFTDANACERYFDKYPNGLSFKCNGKKQLVFVSKGQDVDVVSSALRFYLDCGASRVVRVAGADHDWSMRALYKVAEGNGGRRKVETIIDHCRNEIRTIVFRFTKIADAVTFRGQLLRDTNWEDANIQFLPDPCEKATDVHFD